MAKKSLFSGLPAAAIAGLLAGFAAFVAVNYVRYAQTRVEPLPPTETPPARPPETDYTPPPPPPPARKLQTVVVTNAFDWESLMIPLATNEPAAAETERERETERKIVASLGTVSNALPTAGDFSLGGLMRVDVRKKIAGAVTNAIQDRNWTAYLAYADNGLAAAMQQSAMQSRDHRFDPILKNDLLATLLDQAAVIRRVGAGTLAALCEQPATAAFIGWLMTNRPAMEDLLVSMSPEVDARGMLERWAGLWNGDEPAARNAYFSLALACAIDFARPVKMVNGGTSSQDDTVDMASRYAYFRDLAGKHALKTDIADMPAWQLCWVVDANVPNSELDWARFHVNHSQREMGKAYGDVRYRMDKIKRGNEIYKNSEYTLEQIRREGGICGDQAHYAATAAKAHGIPAMVIGGDGDLGGHAWMGYMASSKDWVFDAGRIGANYANGRTTDPQTGKPIGENALKILADPQRRSEKWLRSYQHLWLATAFQERSRELAAKAFEVGMNLAPRNLDLFSAYVAFLKSDATPPDIMKDAIRDMRVAFRNYPDQMKVANELEAELALRTEGAEEAAEVVHRQTRRMESKFGDRTDILLENLDREIAMLEKAGLTNDIERLYRKALWDHSGSVVLFRDLVKRYADFAKKEQPEAFRDAVWYIGNRFRSAHPRPSPSSYFEAMTYAGLMDMMAGLYDQIDEGDRAERTRKDADRMRKIASEQTKKKLN